MKKLLAVILVILFSSVVWAAEDKDKPKTICPKTKMVESCLRCHVVPSFKVKENKPDSHLDYPTGVKIIDGKGYYLINEISDSTSNQIRDYFDYLRLHKVKVAILDIHSPGGSLFAAWRIKGLINEFHSEGNIIETRLRGFAASAGSILFCAGNRGYRIANPQAELMFHELWSFKFFAFESPSDKEDEAKIFRHLQDTISDWLATRGKISKADLDAKIRKKEFWINGKEAYDLGFVDKLIQGD